MPPRRREPDPPASVDLHGLNEAQAIRQLSRELHAARVRGLPSVRAICGRGFGNPTQDPILRRKMEAWLQGPQARAQGVRGFIQSCRGGALDVQLGRDAPPTPGG